MQRLGKNFCDICICVLLQSYLQDGKENLLWVCADVVAHITPHQLSICFLLSGMLHSIKRVSAAIMDLSVDNFLSGLFVLKIGFCL